jgi:hypothetical protein
VDVAAEVVLLAQHPRDLDDLLHRVVGRADDPRAEEQALDAVAAIEVERQPDDLVDREAGARDVARDPVDAVEAVVDAEVGEEDLEQRDAAAVGRVAVADPRALGRADALAAERVALRRAARGAGGVVLGGVGEDRELAVELHRGRCARERARKEDCTNIQSTVCLGCEGIAQERSKIRPAFSLSGAFSVGGRSGGGTWDVVRRETTGAPSPQLVASTSVATGASSTTTSR